MWDGVVSTIRRAHSEKAWRMGPGHREAISNFEFRIAKCEMINPQCAIH